MNLSDIITGVVVGAIAPFGYMLGSMLGTLRACREELVKIRLATESLHDRVVPEALLQMNDRKAGR